MSCTENTSPNWKNFSFEDELEARKIHSKFFINEITALSQENSDRKENLPSGIGKLQSQYQNMRNTEQTSERESQILNDSIKVLLKEIELLKAENCRLESEIEDLEKEENSAKEENKLHKAYDLALRTYCTNFDFDINIKPVSGEIFKAFVRFKFIEDMSPITITMSRKERKIIEIDTNELFTNEEWRRLSEDEDVLKNIPKYLTKIREYLIC